MTPFLWGVLMGLVGTHVAYALVFVAWWYWLLRDAAQPDKLHRDFRIVRNSIRHRKWET